MGRLGGGDRILVQRSKEGDDRAFEALVLKYQERIFRLIQRLLNDTEVIEDLSQEVFIKTYRSLRGFKGDSSFYTWLYKITLNTCRNHYRSLGRRPEGAVVEEERAAEMLEARGNNPEQDVFRMEFWEAVHSSLQTLPHEQREAVVFCDFEGLNYEEMAAVMGIPIGTVRSRVFRGRKSLRGKLAAYLRDDSVADRGKRH